MSIEEVPKQLDFSEYTLEDLVEAQVNVNIETPKDDDPCLIDEFCLKDNPKAISFEMISAASIRIKKGIVQTSCTRSNLSEALNIDLYLKKEFLQVTGSFKERGSRNALLSLNEKRNIKTVIAASAGNHALSLAYHGYLLNISVVVVMPIVAPLMKISRCQSYGAKVLIKGKDLNESRKIALKLAKHYDLLYVNGYDNPHIIAGQGSLGLEIIEQVPDVEAVVIPVGGGGLIAGMAQAIKTLKPDTMIIGVESEKCSSFTNSLKTGSVTYTESQATLADGLAVSNVGYNALHTCQKYGLIDKMVVVDESYIVLAILRLIELEKVVVEGAGCVGMAAILQGLLPELKNKKTVVTLCGGNIDTTVLGRCIDRGLAHDGRLIRFMVVVSDRPGGIAELTTLLARNGVSIKDIYHERAWLKTDIFTVQVRVVCETRDADHAMETKKILQEKYERVEWSKIF